MYTGHDNTEIYSKFISSIEKESQPILSSLIEHCQNSEVSSIQIQQNWNKWVSKQISEASDKIPFLPDWEIDQEIPAVFRATLIDDFLATTWL